MREKSAMSTAGQRWLKVGYGVASILALSLAAWGFFATKPHSYERFALFGGMWLACSVLALLYPVLDRLLSRDGR